MTWSDFYSEYTEWAESTIRSRISSLKNIGSGSQVVDVVVDLPSEKLKVQLLRKAIRYNVVFSQDDFMNLDGELPDEVYQELAAHTGFDANNPYLDYDNLTWDDFIAECYNWSEEVMPQRIEKLKEFGPPDEVCEIICGMPNFDCENALYEKAVAHGVKFNKEQLENMGQIDIRDTFLYLFTDENIAQVEKDVAILCEEIKQIEEAKHKQRHKGPGFITKLFATLGAFSGTSKTQPDSRFCDGDCANCPPHYGYRYGRWYYGHGHQHGCERGGNGGASGRTYAD